MLLYELLIGRTPFDGALLALSPTVRDCTAVKPLFRRVNRCIAGNMLVLSLSWIGLDPVHAQPARTAPARCSMWVDAIRAEPVTFPDMLDDLRLAKVIYLGEIHSIQRHHQLELELLEGLASGGTDLVLAMEQFEDFTQPALDRFNTGTLDLDGLINETRLQKRWPGYTNYLSLLRAARSHQVPVLALNARAETIRAIGRYGLDDLPREERSNLPAEIVTHDPLYQRWLNKILSVHMAFDPRRLEPAFQAQVARDETMAERLAQFLRSPAGQDRTAVVVCGRGHCEYGLGMPARVSRRISGIPSRIVLFSESGDLHLSEAERKQSRMIEVSHEFLRELGRPAGDYFQLTEPEAAQ